MTIINKEVLEIKNFFLINNLSDYYINSKLYNILNFLLLILPLSLISGPFFSDLTIVISGIILILISIKEKNYKLIFSPLSNLFFCFYFYILIRSLFAENIFLSLESSLFFFRFILFFMSIKLIIEINKNFIKCFSFILFLSFLLVFIFASLQYFLNLSPLNDEYIGIRASGLFGKELIMGSYISRLLPTFIATIYFYYYKSYKFNFLIISIIAISFFLILISGERTALFNIIFFIILSIILTNHLRKLILLCVIVLSTISFLAFYFDDNIKERIIKLTLTETNLKNIIKFDKADSNLNNLYIFAPQHMLFFKKALHIYDSNKIFGVGPKMYREACSYLKFNHDSIYYEGGKILYHTDSCSTHPHNTYIQLLTETGLIGLIFISIIFVYVIFLFLKHLYKKLRNKDYFSDYKISLLISTLITLWPLIPSGNIFNNWLLIIYLLPVGFLIAKIDNNIKN